MSEVTLFVKGEGVEKKIAGQRDCAEIRTIFGGEWTGNHKRKRQSLVQQTWWAVAANTVTRVLV